MLLNAPLDQDELDDLDSFLRDRLPEQELTDEQDEGIIGVSELDGFFTAIVSGPEVIAPSEWLPVVWGDFPPDEAMAEDVQKSFELMVRHMNGVVMTLMDQDVDFEPLFLEDEVDGEIQVDEWCLGYMKGVSMRPEQWEEGGEDVWDLLVPIVVFAGGPASEVLEEVGEEDILSLQAAIPDSAQRVHAYWLERRDQAE